MTCEAPIPLNFLGSVIQGPPGEIKTVHAQLVFKNLAAAEEAAKTLPDGQYIDVLELNQRYEVKSGKLSFVGRIGPLNASIFGVVPMTATSSPDVTTALQYADSVASSLGVALYIPSGVYKCSNGIDKYAEWFGEGAAFVGVFPIEDDKVNMIPGQKHKLPGTVLLFTGSGTKTAATSRTDKFSVMRYGIRNVGRENGMARGGRNFAIVLDFNFRDTVGGAITKPNNDSSADFDIGLLKWNSELTPFNNVTVGGYWKKCGTVHYGRDPDNAHMYELRTMGNIGFAVIGDSTGTNSGFNGFGCSIYGNDHHSRSVDASNERWGESAVYIDIPSPTGTGSVNGINFYGGTIATKTNTPVKYDRCGTVSWFGTVFENANETGSVIAGGPKRQTGTTNTGDINYFGCRIDAAGQLLGAGGLVETAGGTIRIQGDSSGAVMQAWRGGTGIRISGNANQINLQMTSDKSTTTSGTVIRHTNDGVTRLLNGNTEVVSFDSSGRRKMPMSSSTLDVVAKSVTISRGFHKLRGGTVELDTILGGILGDEVTLIQNTSADVITLKDQVGNLRIKGDFTLGSFGSITLLFNGTFWQEKSRIVRP